MHVHVYHGGCQAKFWLEPNIELAQNGGLRPKQVKRALQLISENQDESEGVGNTTLDVEITNIDMQGIWLLMNDKEFFLPFERFPWFRDATVSEIHNVQVANGHRLRWPDLDKDVSVDSLGRPEIIPSFNGKKTRHI